MGNHVFGTVGNHRCCCDTVGKEAAETLRGTSWGGRCWGKIGLMTFGFRGILMNLEKLVVLSVVQASELQNLERHFFLLFLHPSDCALLSRELRKQPILL